MSDVVWHLEPGPLREPVLVCAFRGWNDAASAASSALELAIESLGAEEMAAIDPEEYFDFQATRPTIHLDEGMSRRIEWPRNAFLTASPPGSQRDAVLLDGTEPNLRWRAFSEAILEVAVRLDAGMVVTMGALIADVAHTLPVPVTGMASDPELVSRLGLQRSRYEGPTGIVGVVHDACRRHGIPSASLWAAVPHYVAAVPSPKAALALVRRLESVAGIVLDAGDLESESERYERQVSRAVAENPEMEDMVQNLEREQNEIETEDLPSAESIARDFERYLRRRGEQ